MAGLKFDEITRRRFKERRNVVISEVTKHGKEIGYAVSEQLVVDENGKETNMFLKNGLGFLNGAGMLQLREAVNEACLKIGLIDEDGNIITKESK